MKLVLMGTNDFVVPIFDAARNAGHEIVAVFTRAPKPTGRKHILTPSPVHLWAESHGLRVHTSIKEYNYHPDMVVVVSYGVVLSDAVLASAPFINIHQVIYRAIVARRQLERRLSMATHKVRFV